MGLEFSTTTFEGTIAVEVPESGKPVRILLFNFDDAYVLNVNNQCPGLPYLNTHGIP